MKLDSEDCSLIYHSLLLMRRRLKDKSEGNNHDSEIYHTECLMIEMNKKFKSAKKRENKK